MSDTKTLLFVVNVDWFFISHRLCIAQKAVKEGWRVVVATSNSGRSEEIIKAGIEFVDLPLSRSGTNPFKELKLLYKLYKIYIKINPTIVHHITLKPVIYGSIVAKWLKVKGVVNAISGLGYNFTLKNKGVVSGIIIRFMKFAFNKHEITFIFQNKDDFNELNSYNLFSKKANIKFIKGSGVDLNNFKYFPEQKRTKVVILFASRFLWSKGVHELKKAMDILIERAAVELSTNTQTMKAIIQDLHKEALSASGIDL